MDGSAHESEQEKVYCNKYTGGCGRPFLRPRAHEPGKRRTSKCPKCQAEADKRAGKPRGRHYDCEGCGADFVYEGHMEELGSARCNACVQKGRPCAGGCGVRSTRFVDGNMTCAECKAKRSSTVKGAASSSLSARPSLLSTGYVRAMAERMAAADAASAHIAPSPMFAAPPLDDPIWKTHVPTAPPPSARMVFADFVPIELEPAPNVTAREVIEAPVVETVISEPPAALVFGVSATEDQMARTSTCQKAKGGCGEIFKVASLTGKLPERCPECKAKGKEKPAKAPRVPRAARAAKAQRAPRAQHEGPVLGGVEFAPAVPHPRLFPVVAAMPFATVRIGQLAIDCHSVEAVDALVQRYGAAS